MRLIKLLFAFIIIAVTSSCSTNTYNSFDDGYQNQISLEEVVYGYDLWYIDYHKTTGSGDIPYVSRAFTLSFLNGVLYANNNITDIGVTGNGLGIDVGTYNTYNDVLETYHDIDSANDFEVTVISNNEIRLYNYRNNVNYYLVGYQVNTFDYDKLFYENIEYFLQEYEAWEKVSTNGGVTNAFNDENFLKFIPDNLTTFESSQDNFGTNIASIYWDYVGGYEVYDVTGYEDLKTLVLKYDGGVVEEFELSVINDGKIELYHIGTKTAYEFTGRGFILYRKGEQISKPAVRNSNRKRTKIKRKTKVRRNLK